MKNQDEYADCIQNYIHFVVTFIILEKNFQSLIYLSIPIIIPVFMLFKKIYQN